MADVNVLLTCAGQRVDIVQAFRDALATGPHRGRVLVSDLDPLSPALFHADAFFEGVRDASEPAQCTVRSTRGTRS